MMSFNFSKGAVQKIAAMTGLILLSFSFGCEQPTVVMDRDNINDPTHPEYMPGVPKDFSVSSDSGGTVLLSWVDSATLEDGYLIEKAFGDSSTFKVLAEVPPDTESYIDSTKNVDINTYYKISSFKNQGNERSTFGPTIRKLSLYDLNNLSLSKEPERERNVLSWSVESNFLESLEIEIFQEDNPGNVIKVTPTELSGHYSDDLKNVRFSDRIYKLKGILRVGGIEKVVFEKKLATDIDLFYSPTSASVDVINEMQLSIHWTNRAFFADEIELYKQNASGDYTLLDKLDPETEQYTDHSPVMDINSYQIVSVIDDSKSTFEPAKKVFQWETIPKVAVKEESKTRTNYLELFISAEPSDIIEEYILFRSDHQSGVKSEIARFSKDETTYRDYSVKPGIKYSYTLETPSTLALSRKENITDISILLNDYFEKIKSYAFDYCQPTRLFRNLKLIDNNRYAVFAAGKCDYSGDHLKILDLTSSNWTNIDFPDLVRISDFFYNPETNTLISFLSDKMSEKSFPSGQLLRSKKIFSQQDLIRFLSLQNVVFNPPSQNIFANTNNGSILKIDYNSLDFVSIRNGGGSTLSPRAISLSNDKSKLVSNDLVNYVIDPSRETILLTFGEPLLNDIPVRSFFSYDDAHFFEVIDNKGLQIFSTNGWFQTKNLVKEINIDAAPHPTNSSIIGGLGDANITIFDHSQDLFTHIRFFEPNNYGFKYLRYSGFRFIDENSYIVLNRTGALEIWEKTGHKRWVILEN